MDSAPFIYMVGMNIPADTDAAGLKAFNDFYSRTHVPEVLANNPGFARGTRYELFTPDAHAPRFLAVYQVESEAAVEGHHERIAKPGGVRYSHGPAAWERHDTCWRLTYRRTP